MRRRVLFINVSIIQGKGVLDRDESPPSGMHSVNSINELFYLFSLAVIHGKIYKE